MRQITQRLLTLIALSCAGLAVWIWVTEGGRLSLFGIRITATDPYRPAVVAIIVAGLRMFMGGVGSLWSDVVQTADLFTPSSFSWTLAALLVTAGIFGGSEIAGGSDSYGYLSQADLWLRGNLLIPQPAVSEVPWPGGQWTFAPLAYRPSPSGNEIVPVQAPGFPLLLATAKYVGGQCAVKLIVPLTAGILVVVTFVMGRRVASDQIGAAAAWLAATSPVVLYMAMSPMGDLPAAAFWALAAYGCLVGSRTGTLLGGVAAAMAILIRPNLVHVALLMALWLAARDYRLPAWRARLERTLFFAVPVVLASVAIAALNQHLYGSPTSSGYGDAAALFKLDRVGQNVVKYSSWMIQTQTPLGLLGLIALWVPALPFVKQHVQIEGRSLLGLISLGVVGSYLLYLNFDAWWYLRFLLPCWAAICLGTARLLAWPSGARFGRTSRALMFAMGAYGLWYAYAAGAFNIARHEQRYVTVARLVRDVTEPNSVVITTQHSGSLRYYGERMTLREEVLDDRWLDRTIVWLRDQGMHPYILLDDWEEKPFVKKFSGQNVFGRLDSKKVFEYQDVTSTVLYDPLAPSSKDEPHLIVAADSVSKTKGCVPPGTFPSVFPLRSITP